MKTYLLPIFALLIVGCGNRIQQTSNDEILNDVAQDFNSGTKNSDSILIFNRCTEEAQNYFRGWLWSDQEIELDVLVDSIERIYEPYKEIIIKTIATPIPSEYYLRDDSLILEFAQDTLLLNNGYYNFAILGAEGCGYLARVKLYYHIIRLQKLIDKYYNLFLENAKDEQGMSPLPSMHAQWLDTFENNRKICEELNTRMITEDVLDMLLQRLLFYYHGCQTSPCSDRFDWSWIK